MELSIFHILYIVLAYTLGSIPTSVWVGKWFYNVDVRNFGSGNAGATNTFRVLGAKAGIPVFIVDVFKGWLAVRLPYTLSFYTPGTDAFVNFQLLLGLAAFLGHLFPLFARFKGGKGVATLLGVVLCLHLYAGLTSLAVFTLVLVLFRYVSLGSILAGITFPLSLIFIFSASTYSLIVFSMLVAVLLLITHQKNIGRLIRNEERKVNFNKRKGNQDIRKQI